MHDGLPRLGLLHLLLRHSDCPPACGHCTVVCVQLEVMPSPVFRREDFDLYVDAPIDMVDAALGTTIE